MVTLLLFVPLVLVIACSPPEARAYWDILRGQPKYFVVSGPPGPASDTPDRLERRLESLGIETVRVGCVGPFEQDSYNAVVLRHFAE